MRKRGVLKATITTVEGAVREALAKESSLVDQLSPFPRVAITGGPKTGKTTLALALGARTGRPVLHTDDLLHLDHHEATRRAARWFDEPAWIVEGVAVPRALRKWLLQNPDRPLSAGALYLRQAHVHRNKSQVAMERGVRTVWLQIRAELRRRGVEVIIPRGTSSPGEDHPLTSLPETSVSGGRPTAARKQST